MFFQIFEYMLKKLYISTVIVAIVLISVGCRSYNYLPSSKDPGGSPYGAYVSLRLHNSTIPITGELIAVDSLNFYVLSEFRYLFKKNNYEFVTIPHSRVRSYRIRYANTSHTHTLMLAGFAMPLLPFSDPAGSGFMPFHGFFALFTIPANHITIACIHSKMFIYTNRNLPVDKLYKYARFPQGLPENIDIKKIEKSALITH